MTNEERQEFVAVASKELKQYLTLYVGYPNCHPDAVLMHLPQMWNVLSQKGLLKPGMTYEAFVHFAREEHLKYSINQIIGL